MASALCDARDLVAAYGITIESLRTYEDRGLLRPVTLDGRKYYLPRDRLRLEVILKGKRLGFSLAEIERLVLGFEGTSAGPPAQSSKPDERDIDRVIDALRALTGKQADLDVAIERLKALLMRK